MKIKVVYDFQCLECGKRFAIKAAMCAAANGCPRCGGVDIELAEDIVSPRARAAVQDIRERR